MLILLGCFTFVNHAQDNPSDNVILSLLVEETGPGEEWVITLSLDTDVDYTAFQMDLILPEAFIANTRFELFMADNRASETHIITSSMQRNNTLRVVGYSSDASAFASREGDLFYLVLTAHSPVPVNTYPLIVNNIRFSTVNGVEKKMDNLTAFITASEGSGISSHPANILPIPYWNLNGTRSTDRHGIRISGGYKRYFK
jgi:hypothetical protein